MVGSARRFVLGVVSFLALGGLIGWIYDEPVWGLLIAALLSLAWQVRQVLSFDRALATDNFDKFRLGEGIWQQIFSRVRYDRDRAKRRKADYRKLLREIQKSANAMPDGAVILDASHEIVSANRAAKTLAGLKRKKDKGQRIDNILRDPRLTELLNSGDIGQSVDIVSPIAEGCWLNCRIVPYGAEQQLLILRDITERLQMEKTRRDFVANASHELRSPLTVINGYIDALADSGELSADWDRPVDQMRSQAARMKQLIGEMLELSRLESSGPASHDELVDMAELLETMRADFDAADAAEILIDVTSSKRLLGVRSEIESVVTNLLSNAVRYTPGDGSITLAWQDRHSGAELSVTDTGDGIEAADIPRLTERFYRVHRGRSRDEGGIGLGLAIVKHVLTRHDAELEIHSEPGRGSRFCCRFPASRLAPALPE